MNDYHIYHLSHTDLDGYGCQLIASKYFENTNFYNSNYGKEISERFAQILDDMQKNGAIKNIVLITDLNLTMQQCEEFEKELLNASVESRLLLLDHHKSGQDCADEYRWYYMDDSRCATKITYDFFSAIYGEDERLKLFSDVVNAVDIWLSEDGYFELGKVGLGAVAGAKEVNRIMFAQLNTNYILSLLEKMIPYFEKENAHIVLDEVLHKLKKECFLRDSDNTLNNLVSNFLVEQLSRYKEKMSIKYKGQKGILTFNIGNVSVIGNDFLVKNPDFDFFMDVTSRKTVSFRSNGDIDVSRISKEVANGGGHKNASGGTLVSFKDSFVYENVLAQVKDILLKSEGKHNG